MKITTTKLAIICLFAIGYMAEARIEPPKRLTTDLLEHTEVVMQDGYNSSLPIDQLNKAIERYQTAGIRSEKPTFGWILDGNLPNTYQKAYRILVATSKDKLTEDSVDVWDSGMVANDNSTNVIYAGKPLQAKTLYFWTVKIRDNHGNESSYASPKAFVTSDTLDNITSYYPLQISNEYPTTIKKVSEDETFIAFDRTAFGKLNLTLASESGDDTLVVRFGERIENERVYRKPEGSKSSIRYKEYSLPLQKGRHTYTIKIEPDKRNTNTNKTNESGVLPVLMPDYIGEVYPFRACEISGYKETINPTDVMRQSVHYPFDDFASIFESSDSVLNRIWDMCKYTVKATSFSGIYVDGDRERIAYEADAIIGQLGHYSTDREFSMARRSHEYLLENPTWPTEWNLQSVIIAWNDYMYTGDNRSLIKYYDVLKAKTLMALRQENGLITTRADNVTPEIMKSLNFKGKRLKDIVDWPQSGYIGDEKERAGEADGFKRTTYNTVVNAYHYRALVLMSEIASAVGNEEDKITFAKEAEKLRRQFNKLLFNKDTGHYRDGIGTDNESLHGNMFPLVFGLVPNKDKQGVIDYVKSRRMACSVYGAQFLLDMLYQENEGDYALQLLNSKGERSWYNMIRAGSTLGMEAWDDKYKPNQDWNHVWGAAPANVIPRGLFGIMPIEPGFKTFQIKPQASDVQWANIKVPTIRGDIEASFQNEPGIMFKLEATVPANSTAEIYVPSQGKHSIVKSDDKIQKIAEKDGFYKLTVPSGKHIIKVENKQ